MATRRARVSAEHLIDDPAALTLQIRLLDQFGDNGIVAIVAGSREGEAMRQLTWVVVEEVKSGDWGIGGAPLTASDVKALAAGKARGEDAEPKEELVNRMAKELASVPGLICSFSQPIADMIDDLVSGLVGHDP